MNSRTHQRAGQFGIASPRSRGHLRGFSRSGPNLFDQAGARLAARRDARRQIALVPTAEPGAWTGYIGRLHHRLGGTAHQIGGELVGDQPDLVRRIYTSADLLVREVDDGRDPQPATRGRFLALLTEWRAVATGCQRRVQAAVDHANQLIDCYWVVLARRHPNLLDGEGQPPRPAHVVLPELWASPDSFLLLGPVSVPADEGRPHTGGVLTAHASAVLVRALQIVGEPVAPVSTEGRFE